MNIAVTRVAKSKIEEVDFHSLEFGAHMCDHMLICHYAQGAWGEPKVVPYSSIELAPTALALHYGQSVFEGMKAFRRSDGSVVVFRTDKHHSRLNRSLERMCMPSLPADLFEEGLMTLLRTDEQWVPNLAHTSLYIRPLVFASEARFGVKISEEYTLIIMCGPVGPFYSKPLKVKVENHYARAGKGGTGAAKCSGNYGGAFYATRLARSEGYDQVLWTDLSDELNIEESGTMNVFFRIEDRLITPPLSDSILEGVTRDSILQLAGKLGIRTEERKISAFELVDQFEKGKLLEAFGAGTAAVTIGISEIRVLDKTIFLNDYSTGTFLNAEMESIRKGEKEDVFNWLSAL